MSTTLLVCLSFTGRKKGLLSLAFLFAHSNPACETIYLFRRKQIVSISNIYFPFETLKTRWSSNCSSKNLVQFWHTKQPPLFYCHYLRYLARWRECRLQQGKVVQNCRYFGGDLESVRNIGKKNTWNLTASVRNDKILNGLSHWVNSYNDCSYWLHNPDYPNIAKIKWFSNVAKIAIMVTAMENWNGFNKIADSRGELPRPWKNDWSLPCAKLWPLSVFQICTVQKKGNWKQKNIQGTFFQGHRSFKRNSKTHY